MSATRVDDDDGRDAEYLLGLVDALAAEAARATERAPAAAAVRDDAQRFAERVERPRVRREVAAWWDAWERYGLLRGALAAALNDAANVSRCYETMDEFWADAEAQQAGASPFTFWDTYEHGRRRQLETIIAATYEADAAVLLNSGMSAVAVVIDMLGLRTGATIVTGRRNYFETAEHLERHVSPRGIRIQRVPLSEPAAVCAAIREHRPSLVLFETASNSPEPERPADVPAWIRSADDTLFVCDNSVQGTLTLWMPWLEAAGAGLSARFLVVESATKYLASNAMAGIVYGRREQVERARTYARSTGQQLQEKAFNYLREGELRNARLRVALHARNVDLFMEALHGLEGRVAFLRTLAGDGMQPNARDGLFAAGAGGLLFLGLEPGDSVRDSALRHRRWLAAWQRKAAACGHRIPVRAGFGWTCTCARVYEGARLNQSDAPSYLRLSIGIEPPPLARTLARLLVEAAGEVI